MRCNTHNFCIYASHTILDSIRKTPLLKVWAYDYQSADNYEALKADILSQEDSRRLGGDIKLESYEKLANETLMNAKLMEIDQGRKSPSSFLPGHNFVNVRKQIKKSPVFKIIKKMPKGALLHVHDVTLTSFKYVFNNITYRPNLYISDVDGILKFKFMDQSSYAIDSQWQLLSEVRQNDYSGVIDKRIKYQLSLTTELSDEYLHLDFAEHFWLTYESLTSLLSYRPVYEDYFYQGLWELYKDNVFYVEIRTELLSLYDLYGKIYGPLEVDNIRKEVSDRFIQNHPRFLGVKLIYHIRRDKGNDAVDQGIALAHEAMMNLPGFVISVDISYDDSRSLSLPEVAKKLRNVFKDGPISTHAGKTMWTGDDFQDDIVDAILLGTKRISFGYSLSKHPVLAELARKKGIALELEPIATQILDFTKDFRNHPASSLFADNFPIVICSSSPGLWGAKGLSYDFYEAFMGIMSIKADLRALKKLAINSIVYSAMSDAEKEQALAIWQQDWNQFVGEFAASTGEYYK